MISALGHTPVRFEDFTAQTSPSREACLKGVTSAEVYLLILGPRYGEPLPATGTNRPARVMAELEQLLPARLRASGQVQASDPLTPTRPGGAVVVTVPIRNVRWDEERAPQLLGVRTAADGQTSAWASLPGDGMGAILDPDALPDQIAGLLRLIGGLGILDADQVAIGVGVSSPGMMSIDRVTGQIRQRATSLMLSNEPIQVPPDELMTSAALGPGAAEMGRTLSRTLIDAVSIRR